MRLIDADALIHRMCTHCTEYEECTSKNGDCDDFDMIIINHAPTIESEPIKHGHWIPINEETAKCTSCNLPYSTHGKDMTGKALVHKCLFKYCPNCGSKMDGDKLG